VQETTLSLLKKSTAFFEDKGIGEPRRSSELLLAHSLGQKRLNLYLLFEKPLTDDELDIFRGLVRRRLRHEPVQYIIGETEFYAMEFKVSPAALIPRPETEHLVEAAEQLLAARKSDAPCRALDIGTGSGVIPVVLCSKVPGCSFDAVDISDDALTLARENAARHGCENRIVFARHDIFAAPPGEWTGRFELIVSNPPYVAAAEVDELQPEIREYEPLTAATDNADGLTFYRRIAELAPRLLRPGGTVMVEIGYGQSADVQSIFATAGLPVTRIIDDYSGIPRVVVAQFPALG
jgi:release factor glutamine methyltransferase